MKSVFVSSTFRDMNFERDVLNRSVSPKLNYALSQYNQSVRLLDLRWGVDTSDLDEQQASERVLSVCFDQLDKCQPYIIILLGDRYGYIPDSSNISITHMEILRGAVKNADRDRIFVYMRDADYTDMPEELQKVYVEQDSAAKDKLNKLKAELLDLMPDRCRSYTAHWSEDKQQLVSDGFEQMVQADLEAEFVGSFASFCYKSALHRQLSENEEILADNLKYAYRNDDIIGAVVEGVDANPMPYGIIGDGGCGKSVFLSLVCSAMRQAQKQTHILFCGDNQFSSSVRNAAEYVVYALSLAAEKEYDFEKYDKLNYSDLLSEALKLREAVLKKCYIILDAVDKCDNGMVNFILWCHRFLADKVKIIFSSRDSQEIAEAEKSFDLVEIKYNHQDMATMASCMLKKHGKAVNDTIIDMLCRKATSPLHLNILLTRLLNLSTNDFAQIQELGGGMDSINSYLTQLVEKSADNASEAIVEYLMSQTDDSRSVDFFAIVLSFLVYSPYGLHEDDLRQMFALSDRPWVELDFVDFMATYALFLRTRDNGRIDISHDIMRFTLRNLFDRQKGMICTLMADYFMKKEHQDIYTIRTFLEIAQQGSCQRMLVDFFAMHQKKFTSLDMQNQIISNEIRNTVLRLFLADGGDFVFGASQLCKNPDELLMFQSVLSSCLLSANNYLTDDEVFLILRGCMGIPIMFEAFPTSVMSLSLDACKNFAQRHGAKNDDIDEFFAQCQQVIEQRKQGIGQEDESLYSDDANEMLEFIKKADSPQNDKLMVLIKLSKAIRTLAKAADTAQQSVDISLQLLSLLDGKSVELDDEHGFITYADVYTTLGEAYKTLSNWQKAIEYDTLSLDLYEQQYQKAPSDMVYRKYRERLYNTANVTEKRAMIEKTNLDLWTRTRDLFAKIYEVELVAIAQGIPERELLQCASSIFSLGTALVNTDDCQKGVDKYREAIKLITELTENNPRADLTVELCQHIMDIIYNLCVKKQYRYIDEFSKELHNYISAVIEFEQQEHTDKVLQFVFDFSNGINELLTAAFNIKDIEGGLCASRILFNVYNSIVAIAPHIIKINMIFTGKNIGDMLYLYTDDHKGAAKEYIRLLNTVIEKDLCAADEKGKFFDNANLRLTDVLIRALLCLESTATTEETKALVAKLPAWAEYIAAHSEMVKGDAPHVLYTIAVNLHQKASKLSPVVMMMAYSLMKKEGYDIKAHSETAALITKALFGSGQSNTNPDIDNK